MKRSSGPTIQSTAVGRRQNTRSRYAPIGGTSAVTTPMKTTHCAASATLTGSVYGPSGEQGRLQPHDIGARRLPTWSSEESFVSRRSLGRAAHEAVADPRLAD